MKLHKMIKLVCLLGTLSLLAACGNKTEESASEPAAEIESEILAEAEDTKEEAIEAEALPIPADFQEEIAGAVTDENYEEELAAIEKELESET